MRPIPIPDEIRAAGLRTVVIGESDPTRDDVRPCEYIVGPSALYHGRRTFTAVVELDDNDRAAIAAGAHVWLTLDGGELPWTLQVVRP